MLLQRDIIGWSYPGEHAVRRGFARHSAHLLVQRQGTAEPACGVSYPVSGQIGYTGDDRCGRCRLLATQARAVQNA